MKIALCNKKLSKNLIEDKKRIIEDYFKKASQRKANMIIMPESYLTGYYTKEENVVFLNREDLIFKELIELADKLKLSFIIGFNEVESKDYYISAFSYDIKQKKHYVSRKTHLGVKEKKLFKEGEEISVINLNGTKVGITFCHEIHIPEIYSYQSLIGALISINISAAPLICGCRKIVWNNILPARGLDSRMNVIAVNYYYNNVEFSLGSAAVDCEGNYIYQDYQNDGIHFFEINLDKTKDIRNNIKKYYPKKLRDDLIRGD